MAKTKQGFLPPDPKGEFPFEVTLYLINLLVGVAAARENALEDLLKPHELTLIRFRALTLIDRLQPCSMTELSTMAHVDRTTLTRIVDHLIAKGLVERRDADDDRRRVMLAVTRKGVARHKAAESAVRDLGARLLAHVPEPTQRTMVEGLSLMLREFGDTREAILKVLSPRWPAETDG